MRAAIYLRQSLDVAEGIVRQRERSRKLVEARGWEFVGEYVDNDTSASKTRGAGTGWGRMLADLGRGKVEAVVAVDLDRLLRSTRDLNTLIDLGAKVVTVDGEIDLSTADGEFRATMLAGIARFETRRKSERQRRANEHRARDGKRTGKSRRSFGYAIDGVSVIEAEAEALRDGYRDLLSGVPLAAIARDWNARGLFTTQPRTARTGHAGEPSPWKGQSVRTVLANARNAGIVTYRGEEVRATADGREVVAAWPPIVPEATYREAARILADPDRRKPASLGRYLLTGLALCGVCGSTVYAGGAVRAGVRAYRCSGSLGHVARMAEPPERYVAERVVARLSRPDARDLLLAEPEADAVDLRDEARTIDARLEGLAVDYADDMLTREQFRAASERLRARRAQIEERIADAGRVDVLGPLIGAPDVAAAWEALGVDRQRAVLDLLFTVTLYPVGRGSRRFRPETVGIARKGSEATGEPETLGGAQSAEGGRGGREPAVGGNARQGAAQTWSRPGPDSGVMVEATSERAEGGPEGVGPVSAESAVGGPVRQPTPSPAEVAVLLGDGWDRHRLAEHYRRPIRTVDRWINYANAHRREAEAAGVVTAGASAR